jgi:hypothetical protein
LVEQREREGEEEEEGTGGGRRPRKNILVDSTKTDFGSLDFLSGCFNKTTTLDSSIN